VPAGLALPKRLREGDAGRDYRPPITGYHLLNNYSYSIRRGLGRNEFRHEGSDATSNKAANDEHNNLAC